MQIPTTSILTLLLVRYCHKTLNVTLKRSQPLIIEFSFDSLHSDLAFELSHGMIARSGVNQYVGCDLGSNPIEAYAVLLFLRAVGFERCLSAAHEMRG